MEEDCYPCRPTMNLLKEIYRDCRQISILCLRLRFREACKVLFREAPATMQILKYGICGLGAAIVHNLAFALILLALSASPSAGSNPGEVLEKHALLANFLAFPVGNGFAYLTNSKWIFRPGRHTPWREFALFSVISLVSFAAGLLGGPLLISEGLHIAVAQGGFVITSTLVNFLFRKFLVFGG